MQPSLLQGQTRSGLIPASRAPSRRWPHWNPGQDRPSQKSIPSEGLVAERAPSQVTLMPRACTALCSRGEHVERLGHRSHPSGELTGRAPRAPVHLHMAARLPTRGLTPPTHHPHATVPALSKAQGLMKETQWSTLES